MAMWCGFVIFKQKTAYEMRISDWSSDVCSSDLRAMPGLLSGRRGGKRLSGLLEGIRVLEVAIYAFVPSAGAALADWGADVVKAIGRASCRERVCQYV